jgi:hypothetical protein
MENKISKYLKYAIGEIILVVIGILIALQINNWNETKKYRKSEKYILTEIKNNLREDSDLLFNIIEKRSAADKAIDSIRLAINNKTIDKQNLENNLLVILDFERYFPINQAYEVLKSKGLELSNNSLTTKVTRYYDYEQKRIQSAIYDIEVTVLDIFNDRNGLFRNVKQFQKNKKLLLKNIDSTFLLDIEIKLMSFKDNNASSLHTLIEFHALNKILLKDIEKELKKLK